MVDNVDNVYGRDAETCCAKLVCGSRVDEMGIRIRTMLAKNTKLCESPLVGQNHQF